MFSRDLLTEEFIAMFSRVLHAIPLSTLPMKTEAELKTAGFTESGGKRYSAATTAYCDELFNKSVAFGERDKALDAAREVTHDHVRGAAAVLAIRGQEGQSTVQVWCQIGEYVCAALAGVGGGQLSQAWGILVFGLSLTVGVILFVTRNTRSRSK